MGRKVPTQVHNAATRLMQGKLLTQPPLWYSAVAQYPPLPLPARQAVQRTAFDSPMGSQSKQVEEGIVPKGPESEEARATREAHEAVARATRVAQIDKMRKEVKPRIIPIIYLEDKVRQRFFLDHPFEAFRPRTLVEQREIEAEHPIRGTEWTRLRQRGRNPSSEDCIKFAVSLHVHHKLPLSQAYRTACQQYAALRSEHTIASHIAYLEAKSYGAIFSEASSPIRRGYNMEEKALEKWSEESTDAANVNEGIARKKWRPIFEKRTEDVGEWTRGEQYVHKYKQGERPTWAASSSDTLPSIIPVNPLSQLGARARIALSDLPGAKESGQPPKQ